MVTVPRKTTPEVRDAPLPNQKQQIVAPDAAFGSEQARATQKASQNLAKRAQQLDAIAQEMQRREDETRILEAETQLEQWETEHLFTGDNAVLNRKGNQAFGSTKGSLETFEKFSQDLEKSLTSERQRHIFKRLRTRAQSSLARTVSRHESGQRTVWEQSVRAAAIESTRDRALLHYSDPEERQASLDRLEGLVRENSAGMPEELIQQRIENERTLVHSSIIDKISVEDEGAAKSYYEQHKDEIDPDQQIKIEKSFEVLERQRKAKVQQEINKQIKLVEDTFKLGIEYPDEQVSQLQALARANGMDDQADALGQMSELFDTNKEFLELPLEDQGARLQELQASIAEAPSREKVAEFQMLTDSYSSKIKALEKDPVKYYQDTKQIRPFAELDYSDPLKFTNELDQRRVSIADIQRKEGLRLPLMSEDEIDQMTTIYNDANAAQKTQLLNMVYSSFNAEEAQVIAKRIAPKQASMAAVMSVVNEAPDVANKIAAGSQQEKFVPQAKVQASIQDYLKGAIPDGTALETIGAAVYDIYGQLSFEANDSTNVIDEDRLKKSVDMVVGKPMKVKTGFFDTPSYILPFRLESGQHITEGQFEAALSTITLPKLLETHGDTFKTPEGTNLDVEETINRTNLISVGDGLYQLETRTGQQIIGSDGSPFILDMKKIANTETIKGFFETFTDNIGKTDLDDYVEAEQKIRDLQDEGASIDQINAAQEELNQLIRNAQNRANERKMTSIREGF